MPFFVPGNGRMGFRQSSAKAPNPSPEEASEEQRDAEGETQQSDPPPDLSDHEPLELEVAAKRLGLDIDEVKTRFRTGEFRGFVQAGRLYIYVPEETEQAAAAVPAALDQNGEHQNGEQKTVVEFQKVEITRLIKANKDLKQEKDRLYRLLEREQVLRQGMQRTLERTWQQIAALRKDPDQEETPIELSGFLTTGE
jgi:hypothetical protein